MKSKLTLDLGQRVKRNPIHFKGTGRTAPARIGTIVSLAFDAQGREAGYKVDWHDGDFVMCYLEEELIKAE